MTERDQSNLMCLLAEYSNRTRMAMSSFKIATIVLIVWKKGVCFDAQRLGPLG
jgi:hypothetical protein